MNIVVVGYTSTTEQFLSLIDLKKHQVTVVEKDPDKASEIQSKFDVMLIAKNMTDPDVYTKEIRMDTVDMLLALTDDNVVNLFVLTIGKLYNVPYRIARVSDPAIAELITSLRLGVPLLESSIVANLVKMFVEAVTPRELGRIGEWKIYTLFVTETDKCAWKRVDELGLPDDVSILLVFDGYAYRTIQPGEEIKPGYQLIVLTRTSDVTEVFKG